MNEANIEDALSSLAATAASLNEASDHCNNSLLATQRRLVDLNIGLEYWHSQPVQHGDVTGDIGIDSTETRKVYLLGFTRLNGNWCLALKPERRVSGFYMGEMESPYENCYADGDAVLLTDSPRDMRLAACSHLVEFLREYENFVSRTSKQLVQN